MNNISSKIWYMLICDLFSVIDNRYSYRIYFTSLPTDPMINVISEQIKESNPSFLE